jgi:branched-chain amino acid transport system permease protein
VTTFFQQLVNAVTLGSIYALLGIGISLIFGIMRLVNFAQGELVMVGAYGATIVQHRSWLIILLVTLATPIVFALAMERIAFRPIRQANDATLLVTSFAVSYLLQNVALLIFSGTPRSINLAPALDESVRAAGLVIPKLDFATVAATAVLLVALSLFLARTRLGLHMRAAAEDFTTARLLGVRANRVIAAAFAISGLLCGVAGYLQVSQTGQVFPTMGLDSILVAFIATTLGGLGSLPGAVAGGYLLGVISAFMGGYLPSNLSVYSDAFAYLFVIIVLITRPAGLITPRTARSRV